VGFTECPTALEKDLNPPNTSRCPLPPLFWWDPLLYSSFSRKFARIFFFPKGYFVERWFTGISFMTVK